MCVVTSIVRRPAVSVGVVENTDFLAAVLSSPRRIRPIVRETRHVIISRKACSDAASQEDRHEHGVPTGSLAIQALGQAAVAGVGFCLRPEVVWFWIAREVAEYLRQSGGEYASLFADPKAAAQPLTIRDNVAYGSEGNWLPPMGMIHLALHQQFSDRAKSLFVPHFTTSSGEDEGVLLAALMWPAGPYSQAAPSAPGRVPCVQFVGTPGDWTMLHNSVLKLASEFDGLRAYFEDLLEVTKRIADIATETVTPDKEFGSTIYQRAGNSLVVGWINAFFAHRQTSNGPRLKETFDWKSSGYYSNEFPSDVSVVPIILESLREKFNLALAGGAIGVVFSVESGLMPRLGYAIADYGRV